MGSACEYMRRAAELAARGLGHTRPNPAVGAVIVKGGRIVGEGWHRKAGGDHAEVAAIKSALRHGAKSLKGATLYVTLDGPAMGRLFLAAGAVNPPCMHVIIYVQEYSWQCREIRRITCTK